jgi:hypothetical protein
MIACPRWYRHKLLFVWKCSLVTPCGLVGRYQLFGQTYCLYLRNVGIYLRVWTASRPRRTTSSSSPPWEPQISLTVFPTEFSCTSVILHKVLSSDHLSTVCIEVTEHFCVVGSITSSEIGPVTGYPNKDSSCSSVFPLKLSHSALKYSYFIITVSFHARIGDKLHQSLKF